MSSKSIRSAFALGQLSTSLIVASAGLAVGASALPSLAQADAQTGTRESADGSMLLAQAEDLLNRGQLIRAGETLSQLGDLDAMSEREAVLAADLIGSLERRLKTADPVELSIQKAELASSKGNLAAMNRHLEQAERHGSMGYAQETRVRELRTEGNTIRTSLESISGDFESQASADFEAGRYGRAKSTLMVLTRAGVELSAEADEIRQTIFEMEMSRGAPFQSAEAAGLLDRKSVV